MPEILQQLFGFKLLEVQMTFSKVTKLYYLFQIINFQMFTQMINHLSFSWKNINYKTI